MKKGMTERIEGGDGMSFGNCSKCESPLGVNEYNFARWTNLGQGGLCGRCVKASLAELAVKSDLLRLRDIDITVLTERNDTLNEMIEVDSKEIADYKRIVNEGVEITYDMSVKIADLKEKLEAAEKRLKPIREVSKLIEDCYLDNSVIDKMYEAIKAASEGSDD